MDQVPAQPGQSTTPATPPPSAQTTPTPTPASTPTPPTQQPTAPSQPQSGGTSPLLPVLGVLLLVALIVAGIYLYSKYLSSVTPQKPTAQQTIQTVSPSPVPTIPQSALGNTSTTDTQLNADITTVDKSLDSLDSSLNSVDSGLKDQEGDLQ